MDSYPIKDIEGIGDYYTGKLQEAGIKTTKQLLNRCRTSFDRKRLESETGIGHNLILEWANRADLMRINGVAEEYSDLLEAGGVDTVVELAKRNPDNLHRTLKTTNDMKSLVRRVPSLKEVTNWVADAKTLPRMMEY